MDDQQFTQPRRAIAVYIGWGASALFAIAAFTVGIGLLPGIAAISWPHFAAGAVLLMTGAEGWHAVSRDRRQRNYEAMFPDLLRALATNHASGLTLSASISTAAQGDFGSLTPQLKRMAAQIAFHAPLEEVLQDFSDRTGSPLIARTVAMLQDAMRSGARTTDALHAAARDASRLQELDEARNAQLSQYVAIVYLSFGVFLLVIFVLSSFFISTIFTSDPASPDANVAGIFSNPNLEASFQSLFIWAGTISGAGSGFVIGALLRGRPTSGLHHSFVLTLIGYVTMVIASLTG